jgi:hypothetical protein
MPAIAYLSFKPIDHLAVSGLVDEAGQFLPSFTPSSSADAMSA